MANRLVKRFISNIDCNIMLLKKQGSLSYQKFLYNVLNRYQSQWSKPEKVETDGSKESKEASSGQLRPRVDHDLSRYSSDEDDYSNNKWKPDIAWLSKALEPALQLYKWALPAGNGFGDKPPPTDRTLSEIFASIQRSKVGVQDWSLSDLTVGLYLIYLRQAAMNPVEEVKGEFIFSESLVKDLIYHTELGKGAYRDGAAGLARHSMLRESNVVKFVKNSSVLRPGYYVGIDMRKKLVILGIRGTHTVYDLITNIVSSSSEELTYEGYSTHFGTAEAARWFLCHEMDTIRRCLNKHEGFRLRLVGHSLGAAIASLLAIMIRKKSSKELGFSPEIVSAVGYATPPCVSKELAEGCRDYVTTVVMQDDIVPRLSVASLTRLRNEILETDWASVLEKEDWKGVVDLVTNAKQVVSSVQEVARKLANYANFRDQKKLPDVHVHVPTRREVPVVDSLISSPVSVTDKKKGEATASITEELFVPGSVYCLKRNVETQGTKKAGDIYTLWKRHPGEHFQRILLSSNVISDHKCDTHYYALRDVLKGLPNSDH